MRELDARLIGAWRLVSCLMEDVETRTQTATWGERPNGSLLITPEGRWNVLQTAEGRRSPQTDEARAAAFRSMLAYAGRCRTENGKIIIAVDMAWDESWIGTELVRSYRIEHDELNIEAAPQAYANSGGRVMRALLRWARDRASD